MVKPENPEKKTWSVWNFQAGYGYIAIIITIGAMSYSAILYHKADFQFPALIMSVAAILIAIMAVIIILAQVSVRYSEMILHHKQLIKNLLFKDLEIEEKGLEIRKKELQIEQLRLENYKLSKTIKNEK